MWWNEERIEYYERAAEYTSFHRALADEIEKLVKKDKKIVEFGAGLGYVTELLWKDGYKIRAIEEDEKAIAKANERIGYPLLEMGDAYQEIPEADVYLMIFFGRLAEDGNLEHFMKGCRRIINISGRHTGYTKSKKKDRTGELKKKLDEEKISYKQIPFEHEFNQPLKDEEDAKAWFRLTYGNDEVEGLEKTEDNTYPLLFRNRKRTVITVIDT